MVAGSTAVLVHNCGVSDDQGLAAANAAAGQFKYPGGMAGALFVDGEAKPYALSSGGGNVPDGYEWPSGANKANYHHLEAQSAAIMRAKGANATLYLSGDYICSNCLENLETMVPEGLTLNVVYRNSYGIAGLSFTGTPDP